MRPGRKGTEAGDWPQALVSGGYPLSYSSIVAMAVDATDVYFATGTYVDAVFKAGGAVRHWLLGPRSGL